jgi:leader peptidase (prepilin peptidase) / N-methyltransferase
VELPLVNRPGLGSAYLRRPALRWPALALATLAAVATAVRYADAAGAVAAVSAFTLVILSAIDLEQRRVPNVIVLPASALVLAGRIATDWSHAWVWVAAAFGAAFVFFLLAVAYPPGLGMGDVKLVFLIGATLGGSVLGGLLAGTLLAGVTGLLLMVRHGAAGRRQTLAYAPFLCFGALMTLLLVTP